MNRLIDPLIDATRLVASHTDTLSLYWVQFALLQFILVYGVMVKSISSRDLNTAPKPFILVRCVIFTIEPFMVVGCVIFKLYNTSLGSHSLLW